MFKKLLIGSAFGLLLSAGTAGAEVVVRIAPPAAIVDGHQAVGKSPRVHMPGGLPIAGSANMEIGCLWKGAGVK